MMVIVVEHFIFIFELNNHVLKLYIFVVNGCQVHFILFNLVGVLIQLHFYFLLVV